MHLEFIVKFRGLGEKGQLIICVKVHQLDLISYHLQSSDAMVIKTECRSILMSMV